MAAYQTYSLPDGTVAMFSAEEVELASALYADFPEECDCDRLDCPECYPPEEP